MTSDQTHAQHILFCVAHRLTSVMSFRRIPYPHNLTCRPKNLSKNVSNRYMSSSGFPTEKQEQTIFRLYYKTACRQMDEFSCIPVPLLNAQNEIVLDCIPFMIHYDQILCDIDISLHSERLRCDFQRREP